jgi:hypothetical protein
MKTRALALALLVASCSPPPAAPAESTTTVQITSAPPGLKVVFDGKELAGVTPLEVRAVKAFKKHEVEVLMEGQPSWKKTFAPAAGVKTVLKAEFAAAPTPTPTPDAPAAPVAAAAADGGAPAPAPTPTPTPAPAEAGDGGSAAAPPPAPAASADAGVAAAPAAPSGTVVSDGGNIDPLHAVWPVKAVQLDAETSFLWVPEAGGVIVNLNPKKSYRISAEGAASTRKGAKPAAFARYFLEGEQLNVEDALGTISSKVKVIKNARKMWIFDFDDDVSDNTGKLRVVMQESQYVPPTYVAWDATKKENLIFPDKEKLFTLDGLNPGRTYTFQPNYRGATTREPPWGQLQTIVCRLDGEGPARFEVYPVKGTSKTFSEAKSFTCFYMDASPEPNAGHSMLYFMNAP